MVEAVACHVDGCELVVLWADFAEHLERSHNLDGSEIHDELSRAEALSDFKDAIGRHARGWSFETFPQADEIGRSACERVRAWAEFADESLNLFLFGPPGTGKTGLAISAARHRIELFGSGCGFVNVRRMLHDQRLRLSRNEGTDIEDFLRSNLILDDLGAERPTDWAREIISIIVEARHADAATTIVTSNYSPSQLASRLGADDPIIGQRIVSRLIEATTVVKVDRADQRVSRGMA